MISLATTAPEWTAGGVRDHPPRSEHKAVEPISGLDTSVRAVLSSPCDEVTGRTLDHPRFEVGADPHGPGPWDLTATGPCSLCSSHRKLLPWWPRKWDSR